MSGYRNIWILKPNCNFPLTSFIARKRNKMRDWDGEDSGQRGGQGDVVCDLKIHRKSHAYKK